MSIDMTGQQIEAMFSGLHKRSAAKAFPEPGALSNSLNAIVERVTGKTSTIKIEAVTIGFFATAAVEMWHRAVHSFLISASLTKASPIWASVSGYYSSHYSIRAFAHLFGYFHLQKKHRVIRVEVQRGQYVCHILKKEGSDKEHKFYWKIVKNHNRFATDPFFTRNEEGKPPSDSGHRSKANYLDHINQFPAFHALDESYLKEHIEKIAGVELSDAPIPRTESYPDTENVQLVAYHRIVRFRKFVDEVLGGSNRFWNTQRKPGWCVNFLNFQTIEPKYASAYKEFP
ncbi:MAG: hypothetical protein HY747_03835 [Elusimicrobia bacterium]|nr:hypothetical protein [Elusimicrobiota bacterium]